MKSVLVTGGKGFLGSSIVKRLLRDGFSVRILARARTSHSPDNTPESDTYWGDIRDAHLVDAASKGVDYIIHLVSNFRKGGSDKKDAFTINVEGTENVLRAALKNGVNQLIHCSTIGVHGSVRKIPADENTDFNPGDLYQETKLEAEKRVLAFAQKTGLPTTVIRPISLFGPGDMRMLKLFRLIKKKRFYIVGDGKVLFQPAYIDDVVNGFVTCIGNDAAIGEVFIIGGDEFVPLTELFDIIAAELGVPPPKIKIPMPVALLAADICERIFVPLGIEPPLHRRRISFFQNNRAFSIAKAQEILGYKPRFTLRDGIKKTIQWYESNGWL